MTVLNDINTLGISGAWKNIRNNTYSLYLTGPTGPAGSGGIGSTGPTGYNDPNQTPSGYGDTGKTGPTGPRGPNIIEKLYYGEMYKNSGTFNTATLTKITGFTGTILNNIQFVSDQLRILTSGVYNVIGFATGTLSGLTNNNTEIVAQIYVNNLTNNFISSTSKYSSGTHNFCLKFDKILNLLANDVIDFRMQTENTLTIEDIRVSIISMNYGQGSTGHVGNGITGPNGVALNTGPTGKPGYGNNPTGPPGIALNTGPTGTATVNLETISLTGVPLNINNGTELRGFTGKNNMSVSSNLNDVILDFNNYFGRYQVNHVGNTGSLTSLIYYNNTYINEPNIHISLSSDSSDFYERINSYFIETITQTYFDVAVDLKYNDQGIVDSSADVGENISSIITLNGHLIMSYYDTDNGNLKITYNTSQNKFNIWNIKTIDTSANVGQSSCINIMNDGTPAVSYVDVTNSDLKFAKCSSIDGDGVWTTSTLPFANNVGNFQTSISILANGLPGISFYDETNGDLILAVNSQENGNGTWTFYTVDSTGDVGRYSSLTTLYSQIPGISYYDNTNKILKYAYNSLADGSGTWTQVTVDSSTDVGYYTRLIVMYNSNPGIIYYDLTNTRIKLAISSTLNGSSGWTNTVVISGISLCSPFINTLDNGKLIVSYKNSSNRLEIAINDQFNGSGTWTYTELESNNNTGYYSSITILLNGYPCIVYYDSSSGIVKYISSNITSNFFKNNIYHINYIIN